MPDISPLKCPETAKRQPKLLQKIYTEQKLVYLNKLDLFLYGSCLFPFIHCQYFHNFVCSQSQFSAHGKFRALYNFIPRQRDLKIIISKNCRTDTKEIECFLAR